MVGTAKADLLDLHVQHIKSLYLTNSNVVSKVVLVFETNCFAVIKVQWNNNEKRYGRGFSPLKVRF